MMGLLFSRFVEVVNNYVTDSYNTYAAPIVSEVPYANQIIKADLFAPILSVGSHLYQMTKTGVSLGNMATALVDTTMRGYALPFAARAGAETISTYTGLNAEFLNISTQIGTQALYSKAKNYFTDDLKDNDDNADLISAVIGGQTKTVKALIQTGAQIDSRDNEGSTALTYAALMGHTETVKTLIQAGAQLDLQNKFGHNALMNAVDFCHIEIVSALIQAGAKLDLQDNQFGTALIYAAMRGNTEIVKLLIQAGADITLINNKGQTALTLANEKGKDEVTFSILSAMTFQQIATALQNNPELKDVVNKFRQKENEVAIESAALEAKEFLVFPARMSLKWQAAKEVAKKYANRDLINQDICEDAIRIAEASRKYVLN